MSIIKKKQKKLTNGKLATKLNLSIAIPSNNPILYPIAQNRHTDESRYPESLSHWIPCQPVLGLSDQLAAKAAQLAAKARNDKLGSGIIYWGKRVSIVLEGACRN